MALNLKNKWLWDFWFARDGIENPEGKLVFIAFENYTPEGVYIGTISDPYPVTVKDNGALEVKLET